MTGLLLHLCCYFYSFHQWNSHINLHYQETSIIVNAIAATNIGTSGLAIINSGHNVLEPWVKEGKSLSLLKLVQFSSSLLFFGHAVYNFKSASTLVEETQKRVLTDMHENLKNNRCRWENISFSGVLMFDFHPDVN